MKYPPREECLINALGDDNGESDMPLAKLKQRSKPGDSPQVETVTYIIGVMHILLIFCVVSFLLRSHFEDGSCTLGGALLKAVSHLLPHPGPELHGFSEEGPYLEIYGLFLPVLSQISIPCSPPLSWSLVLALISPPHCAVVRVYHATCKILILA